MKNLASARQAIRQFVDQQIRIDEWDADKPATLYAPGSTPTAPLISSTATEYPAQRLSYARVDSNAVLGSALLPYTITYRYSSRYRVHELPVSAWEAIAEALQVSALQLLPGRGGIRDVAFSGEDYPVRFGRDGTDQADWLATIRIEFGIDFAVTEVGSPDGYEGEETEGQTWDKTIACSIYRAESPVTPDDPETFVLDSEFSLEA
jgi:hypothetical protein